MLFVMRGEQAANNENGVRGMLQVDAKSMLSEADPVDFHKKGYFSWTGPRP